MDLAFSLNHRFPNLAWIASVEPEEQKATVTYGPWIEIFERGFIEGIWDGEFAEAAFDRTPCVFGSGAVVRGETITFVSSASTTDYLYWWLSDDGRCVKVANSLPLLLASVDDELDPRVEDYDLINLSIMSGITRYIRKIPTRKGGVSRLMHWNLEVSPGQVTERDKVLPPAFSTFNDYFVYLSACYGRLAANGRDTRRSRPMAIFSTQSKGYDTTAANAVARDLGIDLVLTVKRGKRRGYFAFEDRQIEVDDDGTDICKVFGLHCVPIERRALEMDTRLEYVFYASLHETGDFNMQEISAHVVRPTVLITGCLGEIWYTAKYYAERPGRINADLVRGDLASHGLTEIRLQAGYVQLAFPYIGARNRADIFRITASEEMEPWRLGTDYDRPIPRRIAEQAGLARNMFGQAKMASVLEYPPPNVPIDEQLRRDYLAFLIRHRILTRLHTALLPLVRRWNALVGTTSPRRHRWNYYLQRGLSKILRRHFSFPLAWRRLNGSIFCFCVNRRIEDYRQASECVSNRL